MREIPVLVGLAILIVFIFLILIAIIFVRPSNKKLKPIEEKELRRSVRKSYVIGLVLGVVAIGSLGLVMEYASRPGFCAGCHEMLPAYKASLTTTHKSADCLSCHQEPGISGVFIEKLQLLEMVFAKTKVVGDVTSAQITNEACLRCHKGISNSVEQIGGIRIKHKEPLEAGYSCTDCHFAKKMFHVDKSKLDKFGMSRCVSCHNEKKASAACTVCHALGNGVTPSIVRSNYPTVHIPDPINCKACHTASTCTSCHSIRVPHPADWKSGGHALQAFVGKKLCWECHDQVSCKKCHPSVFPHGEDWVKEHGPALKAKAEPCSNCHKVDFCLMCHTDVINFKLRGDIGSL
jgi:hypothetical protein